MSSWRRDDLAGAIGVVVIILTILGLMAAFSAVTYDSLHGRHERAECGAAGGRVDFYDHEHDELWRCVRAERSGT